MVTSSSGNAYKFTGKERDAESGLDNFGARYFASTTGRFLSPDDTKYASLADPQTWNLYSYVSNHPLTMTDPTGHSADPWAGRLGNAEYNSFTQEMQGGGVGSAAMGGDSGGADGDMSQATSDGSAPVQHQNDQNNEAQQQTNNTQSNDDTPPDNGGNSGPNAEPTDPGQASTAASDGAQGSPAQTPASLSVESATDMTRSDPSLNYGIFIEIKYKVLDQNGKAIQSDKMQPMEEGTFTDGTKFSGPIVSKKPGENHTQSDGTFTDKPVGHLWPRPIKDPATTHQTITIVMNGKSYAVRTQTFTVTSGGYGKGRITNDAGDIDVKRQ